MPVLFLLLLLLLLLPLSVYAEDLGKLSANTARLSGSFGLFVLSGCSGFPIRQPNERDKLNKPNKQNEPVWSLPTAAAFGLKVDEPLHVISWSVLRNDFLSAVQGSVWRVAQWDLIRSQ